jgi:hypothetical protein
MNKIILSSASLHKVLYEFITPLMPEEDDYEVLVKCNNKTLSFGDCEKTMDVESRVNCEVEIRIGQIRKLFRLLTKVEEQPLTISFQNSHSWIEIFTLLI